SEMNALKKSPVLNRQCLRNKIEELSPLLIKQLNLGMSNKDMLFRATWSYYASGCQERLTSIRRRIEQNAKIVAPTGGPRTHLCKNLNISLPEITLPPGVDLEDHIYREFVSCFRSEDQSSSRPKNPPKRFTVKKELNSIQYSSPEQWKLWKREERKVRQILMQSKDPYRSEELTEKLKKLRKLTNRHPLIELPSPPEEPIKSSLKRIKRRPSIKPAKEKKQESTPTTSILKKKSSKMSQVLEFREEEEKSHVKVQKKKNKLKKASLPIDSLLIIPHKLQEKPKEPKPSRINLRKKSSKVSQVSENSKNKFAVKVKIRIRREKPQIPEEQTLPKEISITNKENIENPHVEKLSTSSDPVLVKPGYKPHKVSYSFQPKSLRQAHSWHSPRGRIKTATQVTNMKDKHRIRRRSHESHRLESIRKSHSWHSPKPDEKYIPFKADRSRRKFDNTPYGFDLVSEENQETKAEVKNKFQYDWPLPIAMRHMEYFKPYGQLKIDGLETNQVQRFPEVCLTERRKSSVLKPLDLLAPPEIRIPFLDSEFKVIKQTDNLSLLFGRTYSASRESNEDLKVPPPIILSDIIMECMNEYGSEISFRDNNFMKPNKLDLYCPEITIKKPQHKMISRGEIKEKKSRKKLSKKLQKMPSKRVAPPCSLCNLVRRRQSELRPYMKRMQMQRQRLELQTYYTQKILKERRCQEQDSQEARIARKRQVLARCYQVLKLCQDLLELRLLQRS
ncbi:hypothetical protein KR200_001260, partial [Drosophila serrata]